MATRTVPINPKVLAWAIDERGVTVEELAQSLDLELQTLQAWLAGDKQPTTGQWTRLADKLKRSRSVFLLPQAPKPSIPPDLRTAAGRRSHALEPEELLQVRRARRLQRYLASLLAESGNAADTIPQMRPGSDSESAATRLRTWLGVSVEEQLAWETSSAALAGWRDALESHGLLVLQLQLGKEGARGLSLLDDVAPLIAVNTAETNEARTFTLMHELAHLAMRSEAACALPPSATGSSWSMERWCDRVAAALLLPRKAVRREVARLLRAPRPPTDDLGLARRAASRFQTSLRAAAVRLIELELAERTLYDVIERTYPNQDRDKPRGGRGGGQPAPQRRLSELGRRTSETFLDALSTRRMTERDARDLLRLDGAELRELRSIIDEPTR